MVNKCKRKKVDVKGMVERKNSNTPNLVSTFYYRLMRIIPDVNIANWLLFYN